MVFEGKCPVCGSDELYKSHYRHVERLLNLFLLRPVRCGSCFRRTYKFLRVTVRPRRRREYGTQKQSSTDPLRA